MCGRCFGVPLKCFLWKWLKSSFSGCTSQPAPLQGGDKVTVRVMESLCISAYEGKCRSLAGLVWDNLDFIWITCMKTATKLQKHILKMMWDIFFLIKSLRNDLFAFLFWRYRHCDISWFLVTSPSFKVILQIIFGFSKGFNYTFTKSR